MTSTSASSDGITIATHIELIRCGSTEFENAETPFVTPIEKRTEVVVMTSCPIIQDILCIIWHNVMQQWSRSGFLELPSKEFDAYGHILRVCYVLQGGSRERSHDLFDYNWHRTLEFLRSGTTSNIYLQFYFWPSGDQEIETAPQPPLSLEDRDRDRDRNRNDGQIEISHTFERQNETITESQNVEEDEVESQLLNQEAHCPEDPRVDSGASSPIFGNMIHKDSTREASLRNIGRAQNSVCACVLGWNRI